MLSYKWILKAIVQKSISILPQREKVNFFFQKNITKGVQLTDEHFNNKYGHALDHIHFLSSFKSEKNSNSSLNILELGSGWYPIVPIMFYLTDLGKVTSVDLQSWMNKETLFTAFKKFIEWEKSGKISLDDSQIVPEKWNTFVTVFENWDDYSYQDLKEFLGLTLIVGDARKLPFDNDSFDFICSNNTFEHIYPDVLIKILEDFKRVIKPQGLMSHFIDLSDHFAHFDTSITIYNFLKFSSSSWRLIDNSIQPQNRLRFKDYRELYASIQIPITKEEVRPGNLELLRKVKVHKTYESYSEKDLAISHGYIISLMP